MGSACDCFCQRPAYRGRRMTRTALVTGAAGGIGAAVARQFLDAGIEVIALVRPGSLERATKSIGDGAARLIECDLADPRERMRAIAELGPVDVLVNNAAIYPRNYLEDLAMEELGQVLQVNVVTALQLMQAVAPHMRNQGWGRIVNITSITMLGGFKQLTAYAASKGAMTTASRIAAKEWGMDSVTVNCLAPGAIPTPAEPAGTDDSEVIARQCLPFRGTADDIADAVTFLASDRARFITGQTLVVDGGWTMS
jgi:3-oxoacyl-[acyl-carrier protein] reductase